MHNQSRPGAQNCEEMDPYPELSLSPALNATLRLRFWEYFRLLALFIRLYYQNRIIAAQNFLLDFRLQLWEVVFVYFKIQIFLVRLSRGLPVNECWPRH